MEKKILIIVPSRSSGGIRNKNIPSLVSSWKETTSGFSDFLLGLDFDDEHYYHPRLQDIKYDINENLNLVPKLNLISSKFIETYKYIFFLGDDHRFRTKNWEDIFISEADKNLYSIYYGEDLKKENNLPTSVFISSNIIKKLGYFVPPCLKHMYADNFWLDLGKNVGCLKYFENVIIEHLHPSTKKSNLDAQYIRVDSYMSEDRKQYQNYLKNEFLEDLKKLA